MTNPYENGDEPAENGHAVPDRDDHAPDETEDVETEQQPTRPTTEESTWGRIGAKIITTIPKPMLGVRGTLFKKMAIKSIENYHKTAGGDAIAINAQAGQQVDLEPVLYRPPEEVEEGEKPGWKVAGRDKVWNPASEGNSVNYLGRTPTVLLEDDSHVEAGWLAPRIGEAVELDNYWPVFVNPEIDADVTLSAGGAGGAAGARADGGVMDVDLGLESPGEWMGDNYVDLDSGDGYDGMRISTAKAREWQAEHLDSEHGQMQEDRGYLRGLANGDEGPSVFKLLLLCAAIILGTLAIVLLGPELVGGGGDGGSVSPLIIGALGAL